MDADPGLDIEPVPEPKMEPAEFARRYPDFVRLTAEIAVAGYNRASSVAQVMALHRWHREQVEKAVREAVLRERSAAQLTVEVKKFHAGDRRADA